MKLDHQNETDIPSSGHTLTVIPSEDHPTKIASLESLQIDPEAIRALPAEFAKSHNVLPFAIQQGRLCVATDQPGRHQVIDDIRLLSGMEVSEFSAPAEEITAHIGECYQLTVEQMIENLHPDKNTNSDTRNLHDIEVMANEPTVINLVNLILSTALRERASDIHLLPFENELQLRYRIDGLLLEKAPPPKHLHPALISRIKIMADMNIAERFMPQDGHIQIHHRGSRVDIRVGTMPTIYGESIVLRLLEKGTKLLSPEELGLDPKRSKLLARLTSKPHGLFLATGPTGSGKTTSLYSILNSIYTPEKKIITIEDPVEYELPGVAQIPVRPNRSFTFARGLRSILRQDPDVVMVGEIRDSETAEIAIRAALTGHQVFSTLHTNDSSGAVTRLLDMGIEAFLIASSLDGVLAQRLVRRICNHCRTTTTTSDAVREKLSSLGQNSLPTTFHRGTGCEECGETGYRGRIGIFELLPVDAPLRDLILQKRSTEEMKQLAHKRMITLFQDAMQKAVDGTTSLDEVLRVAAVDLTE